MSDVRVLHFFTQCLNSYRFQKQNIHSSSRVRAKREVSLFAIFLSLSSTLEEAFGGVIVNNINMLRLEISSNII